MLQSGNLAGDSAFLFDSTSTAFSDGIQLDTVTIPDAHLLFHGDFKRSGSDLKLTDDTGQSFVVRDYFKTDKHPTLLSPEGASLSPDVVDALAGPLAPGQYAQAGAPQAAQAIGRVAKVDGNATVVRNGVAITLNVGDAILKGDVAQTGNNSAVSLVFTDGTTFALTSNARMVLNEFVYSPGGTNNSALISLVQGSITFLAGQVAKTGDMKVDTPVATMGIRGTLVKAEFDVNLGTGRFTVQIEKDGSSGSYVLINKFTGAIIATVNQPGVGYELHPTSALAVAAQQFQVTSAEMQAAFVQMQNMFNDQAIGLQQILNNPNPPDTTKDIKPPIHTDTIPPDPTKLVPGDQPPPVVFKIDLPKTDNTNNNTTSDPTDNTDDPIHQPTLPDAPPPNLAPFFLLAHDPITRISVDGEHSYGPHVSDNGRYVVFIAGDELPQDNNHNNDGTDGRDSSARVYIFDRDHPELGPRSLTDNLPSADLHDGESFQGLPSISADGHWVVFQGEYQTIENFGEEGQETVFHSEIFLYDSQTNTAIKLAERAADPVISPNGERVVFSQFVEHGESEHQVIQVMDLTKPDHPIVATIEGPDHHDASNPTIDGGGHAITFISADENGVAQIYLFDLDHPDQGPQLVSHGADGTAGNHDSGALNFNFDGNFTDTDNWAAGLSGDGQFVVFQSNASNLVAGDNNAATDIFLYDRAQDKITLVSHNNDGGSSDGDSIRPEISLDGHYIVFVSAASDLVGGDTNGQPDVFIYDRLTGDIRLVSVGANFTEGNGDSEWGVSVTSAGVFTVFGSEASNLADGDTNNHADIFLVEQPNAVDDPAKTKLTDDGVLKFTDTVDHHTVKSEPAPGHDAPWGTLTSLTITNDTTGDNTDGSIAWHYEVNRTADVAKLGVGETHIDYFKVDLTDSGGNTVSTTLAVTIVGVDDAPEGNSETLTAPEVSGFALSDGEGPTYFTFTEDTTTVIPASFLLANDTDIEGNELSIVNAFAQHGTVSLHDGNVVYTPDKDFNGDDSLTYVISDGHGGFTPVTDSFAVTPVNDAPVIPVGHGGGFAYMTGSNDPWSIAPDNVGSPDAAMNTAFGAANWTKLQGFTTTALNGDFQFIYIDGGDGISGEFNTFISSNVDALQTFVSLGGHLLINAARWDQPNLDLGFGATMVASYSAHGYAVDPDHPIFIGPNGAAGSSWMGNWFAHDAITGAGLTPLITGDQGQTLLAAEQWGSGLVLLGGMTSPYFQSPGSAADILRANIISFAETNSGDPGPITAPAGTPGVPIVLSNDFSFSDPDIGDTHTVTSAFNAELSTLPSDFGAFTASKFSDTTNGSGGIAHWEFSVDPKAVNALVVGTYLAVYDVTVTDAAGASATHQVTVTINGNAPPPNSPPIAQDDTGAVAAGNVATSGNLLTNDSDPNSDALTISNVADGVVTETTVTAEGTYGELVVTKGTGAYTYTLAVTTAQAAAFAALAAGVQQDDHFTYTADDGHYGTANADLAISVTGINDAPEFTGDSVGTMFLENGPPVAIAANVHASDVDSINYDGGSLTATVTHGGNEGDTLSIVTNDLISLSDTTVMFDADGEAGAAPVAIGTLTDGINSLVIDLNSNASDAAVEALAQAINFGNTKQNPIGGTRTVTFTLQDGGGIDDNGHNLTRFETTVDVNQPPALLFDGAHTTPQNGGVNFHGLTVSDLDAGTSPLQLTVSVLHGSLAPIDLGDGITPIDGDGSDGSLSFTGSLEALNNALANGVLYTSDGSTSGDTMAITVDDLHGGTDTTNVVFSQAAGDRIDQAARANMDILILASDDSGYPVKELQAQGFHSVTAINSTSNVDLATLENYDAILAYTNYAPASGIGDALKSYVDDGGSVVLATYAMSGQWQMTGGIAQHGYAPLTPTYDLGYNSGSLHAVTDDAVFDNIDLSTLTYWQNSNFAHPGLDSGAELLATDGSGINMIAINADQTVMAVNIFPNDHYQSDPQIWKLFGNALAETASEITGATLNGTDQKDIVLGTHGNDTLIGAGGDDFLVGRSGVDTFVFAPNSGNDTIADFKPSAGETVDLADYHFNQQQFQDILGSAHDIGVNGNHDILLQLTPNDSITFQNLTLGDVQSANFLLTHQLA